MDDQAWGRHRRLDLIRTAARCFSCDAPLTSVVVRLRDSWRGELLPFCEPCADARLAPARAALVEAMRRGDRMGADEAARTTTCELPAPCEACGRVVIRQSEWRHRRHVVCSTDCGDAIYNQVAIRAAKDRGPKVRGPRPCAVCGETFVPRRADAITCSSACRQKAYRKRRDI
jgi:hypothetical protein